MLNLTPLQTNNLVIYADTITNSQVSYGNYFLMVFTNTYSKQTFAVVPSITKRNSRFVELEIFLTGATGSNDPVNGEIYLYPEGNYEYMVFNTTSPTLQVGDAGEVCSIWNTDEDFWNFASTIWNVCGITAITIDRGQAFLYSEVPDQREVEFIPYEQGNNLLEAIVYVSGVPLTQQPCDINGTTFKVNVESCSPGNPGTAYDTSSISVTNTSTQISTGVAGYVTMPFAGTITGWKIVGSPYGSIVVDVWKDTVASFPPTVADTITGSEKPTLSSAIKNEDLDLTTWTTGVATGDIMAFNVDSASTLTNSTLTIFITRTV